MNLSSGLPHDQPWAFYFAILLTAIITWLLYWFMNKRKML
jgi:Mg2+ and Co2+ transporter CorA